MKQTNILGKLFSSKARVEILALLFLRQDRLFYPREIERAIRLDYKNISRELKNLENIGLLASRKEGNLKIYSLNKKFIIYPELRTIFLKTKGASAILKQVLSKIKEIEYAFIHGSVAAGTEDDRSDIDLMVIGDVSLEKILKTMKEPEEVLGREINASLFSIAEFKKRLKAKDPFLNHVMHEPIIFLAGDEDALRKAAE